jgi:uncharacterized protein YbjT (DUF2867 family)
VVRALATEGFHVRVATREPRSYRGSKHITPVWLDYHEPVSIEPALLGADGLFLIALPLDYQAPRVLEPVIDQAKNTGIKHVVLHSALNVDLSEEAPLRIVERYLLGSGIHSTILRSNFFMENFVTGNIAPSINESDGIFLPAGDGKTSFITTGDIAAVATTAFRERLFGEEFNLTGPEALDHYQVATILSEVLGRTITYRPLEEGDFLELLGQHGLSDSSAKYLTTLYGLVRTGLMAKITDDVLRVTGHAPKDFRTFAEEHAKVWRGESGEEGKAVHGLEPSSGIADSPWTPTNDSHHWGRGLL